MSPPVEKPKKDKLRILNLEDNPNDSELILAELETKWPQVEFLRVATREAFVQALAEFKPEVILSDFKLPDINGREALSLVRQTHPDIPVIMVTGALGDIEAADLVKSGAKDYVMKDHLQRLTAAVQGALSLEQGIRTRKSMEHALQESEASIRALVEHSPVAMIVDVGVDADEQIVMMNQRFTKLFGYTLEDIPDVRHWWPIAYPDEKYREEIKAEWIARVEKAIQSHGDIEPIETTVTCKGGAVRYVRISLASIGSRNIVTFEDLTEHKQAEAKIQRLNQLYSALSHCSQAIVHSTNEAELFTQICKATVEYGGFEMAWIGVHDPDTRMVKSVSSFGNGAEEYLRDIKISADAASEYGQGPTGCALRENQPFWCQDFQNSPLTTPWHERGAALGWRSSAALPLRREGVVFGAFSLYAGELNAFDEEARELLIEMSADISHALDNFRHDAERKNAEEKLAESERHFRAVTESANDAIITGAGAGAGAGAGDIVGWNTAAERLFGYSEAEIIGQPLTVLMPERFRNLHSAGLARVVAGETPHMIGKTVELAGLRKDGSEFPLEISLAQWQAADGQFFTATIRDITQRKQTELKLAEQVEELRRWQEVTLGREMRTMELKHEVNELLGQAGQPPRYPSAEQADAAAEGSLRSSGPS